MLDLACYYLQMNKKSDSTHKDHKKLLDKTRYKKEKNTLCNFFPPFKLTDTRQATPFLFEEQLL